MDTLYTFWENITHDKTESAHFLGLITQRLCASAFGSLEIPGKQLQYQREPRGRRFLQILCAFSCSPPQAEVLTKGTTLRPKVGYGYHDYMAPKYLYRDYFKAKVGYGSHGPFKP